MCFHYDSGLSTRFLRPYWFTRKSKKERRKIYNFVLSESDVEEREDERDSTLFLLVVTVYVNIASFWFSTGVRGVSYDAEEEYQRPRGVRLFEDIGV